MSRLSRPQLRALVHQALAARVRLLLGQSDFDELLAVQVGVGQALAAGAWPWHAKTRDEGMQALAQAALEAFGLDPVYYGGSALDFIVCEALASAGTRLADAVRGHEGDSRADWLSQVVPQLQRIEDEAVAVFDGSWAAQARA